jgi:hypothetical protein
VFACHRYGWADDPAYAHLDAKGVELVLAHYELLSPMFPVQMLTCTSACHVVWSAAW